MQAQNKPLENSCDHADRIEHKKCKITQRRFNDERDDLRKKHHEPANRSAIKQKASPRAKKRGKSESAAVDLIKKDNKQYSRYHAKDQILKKDHDPERTTLPSPMLWLEIRQAHLAQTVCRTSTVMHSKKYARDAKEIIKCTECDTEQSCV